MPAKKREMEMPAQLANWTRRPARPAPRTSHAAASGESRGCSGCRREARRLRGWWGGRAWTRPSTMTAPPSRRSSTHLYDADVLKRLLVVIAHGVDVAPISPQFLSIKSPLFLSSILTGFRLLAACRWSKNVAAQSSASTPCAVAGGEEASLPLPEPPDC
ncbi:hypothetical protein VPH35_062158 [Triticum aestivum]